MRTRRDRLSNRYSEIIKTTSIYRRLRRSRCFFRASGRRNMRRILFPNYNYRRRWIWVVDAHHAHQRKAPFWIVRDNGRALRRVLSRQITRRRRRLCCYYYYYYYYYYYWFWINRPPKPLRNAFLEIIDAPWRSKQSNVRPKSFYPTQVILAWWRSRSIFFSKRVLLRSTRIWSYIFEHLLLVLISSSFPFVRGDVVSYK